MFFRYFLFFGEKSNADCAGSDVRADGTADQIRRNMIDMLLPKAFAVAHIFFQHRVVKSRPNHAVGHIETDAHFFHKFIQKIVAVFGSPRLADKLDFPTDNGDNGLYRKHSARKRDQGGDSAPPFSRI